MVCTDDGFDYVYAYTRKDALADGVLVDVTEVSKGCGFKHPVAVTSPLWESAVSAAGEEGELAIVQIREILLAALFAIRIGKNGPASEVSFLAPRGIASVGEFARTIYMAIGPGDEGEAVITMGFPKTFDERGSASHLMREALSRYVNHEGVHGDCLSMRVEKKRTINRS